MNIKNSLKVTNSALPLYSRVESIIRNKIMNGQLMPGDLLPKEQDLAAQFNVSQITIRTALSRLKEEGLIVRSRAKGTFVADTIPEKQQFFLDMDDVYHLVRDASKYEVKIAGFDEIHVREARYPRDLTSLFRL
jgi:DNA-binding GntR family transcriptional regulator